MDEKVEVEFFAKDGDRVEKGQHIAEVTGDIRALLSGERTALNFLQRMSGIATYTAEVAALLKGSKTKLLDTRKTTPNMRIFEKYAVKCGGGNNHRYNLSDGELSRRLPPRKRIARLCTKSRWRLKALKCARRLWRRARI